MGPFEAMAWFGAPTFMEYLMSPIFVELGSIEPVPEKDFHRLIVIFRHRSPLGCRANWIDGQTICRDSLICPAY